MDELIQALIKYHRMNNNKAYIRIILGFQYFNK